MTNSEIKVNVLQAKNQRAQIKICAQLNDMPEEQIRDILKEQGVDLRTFKGSNMERKPVRKPKWLKSMEEKKEKAGDPFTEITARIKELRSIRDKADKDLSQLEERLNAMLAEIKGR